MIKETNEKKLLAERDRLRERIKAIERDVGRGLDKDLEDQAIQLENAEVLNEIMRLTQEELQRIEAQIDDLKSS